MDVLGACFMLIRHDFDVNNVFFNCANAPSVGVSQRACSKLTRNKPMLTTVTSFYANPYSRTTYANDVKNSKLCAGTTAILNIEYASSSFNYTPEKAERKRRKQNAPAGRTFVDRRK